jgi:hypothetical protein
MLSRFGAEIRFDRRRAVPWATAAMLRQVERPRVYEAVPKTSRAQPFPNLKTGSTGARSVCTVTCTKS